MSDDLRESAENAPILLYDGVCGFCNHTVQMIIKRDRRGTMKFAALQSEFGQAVIQRQPQLQGIDSLVFVDRSKNSEQVFVRSAAALRVAAYLGGPWHLLRVTSLLPRKVRDFFYDLFARYRYRMFGKYESCMLPPPETRARFMSDES